MWILIFFSKINISKLSKHWKYYKYLYVLGQCSLSMLAMQGLCYLVQHDSWVENPNESRVHSHTYPAWIAFFTNLIHLRKLRVLDHWVSALGYCSATLSQDLVLFGPSWYLWFWPSKEKKLRILLKKRELAFKLLCSYHCIFNWWLIPMVCHLGRIHFFWKKVWHF